ncbi:protein-ADP-ribose hydrolase [Virgibacillus sp. NKC19-3]|uniref:protein-ADP-ribose hydrolase n=1 Tax=Virgibacillus saliphilus TaxID=2831674 RepID=UPI001C9A36C5|nr:protein-ADP-ribose hydrolase [Virgibacillus sp. NKC19-3]MBY7141946.1 protein-ADP-ribose hydrolase [Virgibacillus sp. NKC19-3]
MDQEARLDYLIDYLWKTIPNAHENIKQHQADTVEEKIAMFQGLCNIRQPDPVPAEFVKVQDAFLTAWNNERHVTSLHDLEAVSPQLYLWQGDITSLAVDAIVNAANSELLGCTRANHHCIDNIIHTRAGVQLRLACNEIIQAQGRKEPMGKAKITNAYNLPSRYVIHTVGPFIDERGVSPLKEQLLASSYEACLALADQYQLDSIAFCCISTGEFHFPHQRAAEIAIQTVRDYVRNTGSKLDVIFNVYSDEDVNIYRSLLDAIQKDR